MGRSTTMRAPGLLARAGACAGAALLAACSAGPAATPGQGTTIAMTGDYLAYDEQTLVIDATLVVEGTVLSTEVVNLRATSEGDTPEENPLLGLPEAEKEKAITDAAGIPVTAVTFRVDTLHKGTVRPGDEITIHQTGGVADGVAFVPESEIPLETGRRYLLFTTDDLGGAYAILGGSAGTYVDAGDGTYVAASPDMAPFDTLTSLEVAALTR